MEVNFGMLYGLVSYQVDISLLKFPIHLNDCSLKMGLRINIYFCYKTLMCRVTVANHPALEHLNTVDNKKCKYAMHIGVLK